MRSLSGVAAPARALTIGPVRTGLALGLTALATLALPSAAPAQSGGLPVADNPCLIALATGLLCPDLVMKPPFDLTLDRRTRRRRVLLRAGNSIDSVGLGPAELRGRRSGPSSMRARQAIHRQQGGVTMFDTGAGLGFKPIPGQYRYWKFRDAARFELWSLDPQGQRRRLVRTGPKVYYCLRDLVRSNPSRRSPRRRVYPACSQSLRRRRVTLGTSVGWSDVYPASYHEQWIDVTGLRGRFAFVHIADPRNGIWELDETNNEGVTIVRLPSGRAEAGSEAGAVEGGY